MSQVAAVWRSVCGETLPGNSASLTARLNAVFTEVAAKAATTTIPIVFVAGGDPVKTGLVTSLHQPGGNLTGVTTFVQTLGTKQIGLLRELIPTPGAIAFLTNPNEPATEYLTKDVEEAARIAKERLIILRATTEREIDAAFAYLVQQGAVALLIGAGAFFFTRKHQLIEQASRHAGQPPLGGPG